MKKKIIIGIVSLVIVASVAGIYMTSQNKAVEVNTSAVIKGDIAKYVEELGVVRVKNNENIYSPTAGKVTAVLVEIEDKVKTGDVLLKLDGEQLSRQVAVLDAQRAAILAQYNEAKKPTDGNSIQSKELEMREIIKRIDTAKDTVDNKKQLYDAGAISSEEYQAAVRNLETENSNLSKAKLELELLRKPVSGNIAAQYEAQLKQLDIQKQDLIKTGEDFTIIAGMDGTVLQKFVEKGSYLQPGMHIMEVGNVDELYIESDILIGDISDIKTGSEVWISNKDLGIKDIKGVVVKIHPIAISKISDLGIEQKRIKVDIEMIDSIVDLRPGYDLDIKIIIDSKQNTLLIPENAVFKINDMDYIFVNENNKAVLKQIETGIESDRQIEILSGLVEGEIVILSPDSDMEEGISIKSNQQE